jgi:hypothetical protein
MMRRDDAIAATLAGRHHLGIEGRRHRAPFRGRIGMGDAAAERAAGADRIMRDVADDIGQEAAERAVLDRLLKHHVADTRPDAELAVLDCEAVEFGHAVDVDQMARTCQAEGHRRHQALPTGEHPAVVIGEFRQQIQRFVDGFGSVIVEGSGLHFTAP